MKYLVFVFLVLPHASSARLEAGPYDYRPSLYIDGPSLAYQVYRNHCDNPTAFEFGTYEHRSTITSGALGWGGLEMRTMGDDDQAILVKLHEWVLEQPDNSILPDALVAKAMEITEGNMLEALRVCYDYLGFRNRDGVELANRSLWNKMVDITGEQRLVKDLYAQNPEREVTQSTRRSRRISRNSSARVATRGSKASAWYHFFGAAAIGYDRGIRRSQGLSTSGESQGRLANVMEDECPDILNETFALGRWSVGRLLAIEHIVYHTVLGKFRDPLKREQIDIAGGKFGAQLAGLMRAAPSCDDMQAQPNREYLYDNDQIYGDNWVLRPGEMPWEFER